MVEAIKQVGENMSTVIIGNVGREPELKFLPSGVATAKFSVAVSKRVKQGDQWVDGETTWYRGFIVTGKQIGRAHV